ncbi:disease resistance protein, partial [Trifolium medium]|nr:disease resistance protein [Trifolium medium]
MMEEALLKNEWIHAEVVFGFESKYDDWDDEDVVESGIHLLKNLTNMDDDIQFIDSALCKNRRLYEYLSTPLSLFHPPVRLVDVEVSETELVDLQQRMLLLLLVLLQHNR